MTTPVLSGSLWSQSTLLTLLLVLLPLAHGGIRRLFQTWWAKLQLVFAPASPTNDGESPTVSALYIHPVKSLRAVELESSKIDNCGFVRDRRLMLVCPSPRPVYGFSPSDATHRFISQRQCPELATVTARYLNDMLLQLSWKEVSITVSLQYDTTKQSVYRARLWDNVVEVVDLGDVAAKFFQDIVGSDESFKNIRLTHQISTLHAPDKYVPPEARTLWGRSPATSLTDGFPILIACEASLDEVNRRLRDKGKDPIPMSRFRPNIVIRNTKAFEEDSWKIIEIGATQLHIVKGCPRCKQSCTDQITGQVSDEPLATLADFRAVGNSKSDVYFAQNAIAFGDSISVNDVVKIIKIGDPIWDKGE
ncbi:MOSC N-terminal beta barrel domain [Fragilaria crotonensis]|nr:MOSC N-terminal beta barrel domain [Fragilaria crotonensis]